MIALLNLFFNIFWLLLRPNNGKYSVFLQIYEDNCICRIFFTDASVIKVYLLQKLCDFLACSFCYCFLKKNLWTHVKKENHSFVLRKKTCLKNPFANLTKCFPELITSCTKIFWFTRRNFETNPIHARTHLNACVCYTMTFICVLYHGFR